MGRWMLTLILLIGLTNGQAASAGAQQLITIDFDDIDTSATGIALLTDHYRPQGALFVVTREITGDKRPAAAVVDGLYGNGATSLPNSVSYGYSGYLVRVIFVDPITGLPAVTDYVSAWVGDRFKSPTAGSATRTHHRSCRV